MLGLLAFSLVLTDVFVALRPRKIARKIGLPAMYSIHGLLAIVVVFVVILHIANEFNASKRFLAWQTVTPAGFASLAFLLLTVLTGVFILSNTFIRKSNLLLRLKDNYFKRELGLWLHRLSVLAVLTIFIHMMSIAFIRTNTLLSLLATFYVLLAVGGFLTSKITKRFLPTYILKRSNPHNSTVHELEFEAEKVALMDYEPGQYVFVRFIKSEIPKESHPFSISSAPAAGGNSLSVMVKESGDYTRLIGELKNGDLATLEGPYGNFFDIGSQTAKTPLVMLAGGIGITPILSILRSQIEMNTGRKMVLVWGLSSKEDLLLLEELQEMKQNYDHFSYYITLSQEEAEPFDHGQITSEYLQRIGIDQFYPEADFFICGPPSMMEAMKAILRENKVAASKIHREEFSL